MLPTHNRLAQETSPYLQQHANNPVDWYPWGQEALQRAKAENKPILLSIGYSACHWCHVMAHESFEDIETAELMNRLFINIKVDREERPDLDQIYQNAHAVLTRRNGGWPLTMFLTPEQMPFFGGTYFPKTARYGLPGFKDLLTQISTAYRDRPDEIEAQNNQLRDLLARQNASAISDDQTLQASILDSALQDLEEYFDKENGGIGDAPKFPHPTEFMFCLQRAIDTNNDYALGMVKLTLAKMAEGGIYDQIGGGFCRYSVDGEWSIPHFEKMLYDNALLLTLYSDAWRAAPHPLYERVVAETAAWVMREMQDALGGYYSSLDADSEHEEGKFYVWTPDEVRRTITSEEYAIVAPHYGLDTHPNFEGHWHLRVTQPLDAVASQLNITYEEALSRLNSARTKLFMVREQRIHPGRDEKILTSWNALMIKGMVRAARVFERPEWLASARAATQYLYQVLWNDNQLLATAKDGQAHLNAYLDDHAFLLDALLELISADFRITDLKWAQTLADELLERFEDKEGGGFFFTSHDHETLIQRNKITHDQAIPAGNGIVAFALQRLGYLLGETHYLEAAERTLRAFHTQIKHSAASHTSLCVALAEYLVPPTLILLRGTTESAILWKRTVEEHYLPHVTTIVLPNSPLPPAIDKPAPVATTTAWVCRGNTCLPPIENIGELMESIEHFSSRS